MINLRNDVQYRIRIALLGAAAVAFGFAFLNRATDANGSEYDITSSVRMVTASMPVARRSGTYRVGEPYVIAGRTYTPQIEPEYRAEGTASWYGDKFHGRLTANGEVFDTFALSAAHPTLPLPSYVRVTNLENHRSLIVRLNDRGPFHDNRLIDVSVKTAQLLGFYDQGLARVRVDYVGPAGLEGSDDDKLAATLREGDPPATVAAESVLVQPREREEPATVAAEYVSVQPREDEVPAAVIAESAPAQPRNDERPAMEIVRSESVQQCERELPDREIAEPVIALIPHSVALLGDDEDARTDASGPTVVTVVFNEIFH